MSTKPLGDSLRSVGRGRIRRFLDDAAEHRRHVEIDDWLRSYDESGVTCITCGEELQVWETLNGWSKCEACLGALAPKEVVTSDEQRMRTSLDKAGVLPVYQRCSSATWKGRIPEEYPRFVNEYRGCWYIHGEPGRGKTHLAVAALRHVFVAKGAWCLWRDVTITLGEMKRHLDGMAAEVKRLNDCSLLVLDDFGSERGTDFEATAIGEVIRYRHGQQKPTIITSNLSPEQLQQIEPRIKSRICSDLVTHLGGRDRRFP